MKRIYKNLKQKAEMQLFETANIPRVNQIIPNCACDPQLRQIINIIYVAKSKIDNLPEDKPAASNSSIVSAS